MKCENYFNTLNSMSIPFMVNSLAPGQFWAVRTTTLSTSTSGHVFRHLTLGAGSSANVASQSLPCGVPCATFPFSWAGDGWSPWGLLFCCQGFVTVAPAARRRLPKESTAPFSGRLPRTQAASPPAGIGLSLALTCGYSCCDCERERDKSRQSMPVNRDF